MHAARFSAVLAVVEALVRANRISVTALGRMVRSRARPKHSIKRVDRLLSNPRLHAERQLFFRAIARQVIGDVARPIVLMDWTGVVEGFSALVAAVPVGGRASTIYAEAHPERDNNKQHIHARFLRALRAVLVPGCRPIIVVDAGFKGPFFEQVRRLAACAYPEAGRRLDGHQGAGCRSDLDAGRPGQLCAQQDKAGPGSTGPRCLSAQQEPSVAKTIQRWW
jgi:hypothetical protein